MSRKEQILEALNNVRSSMDEGFNAINESFDDIDKQLQILKEQIQKR